METIEINLPSIWASYLVNGDSSGLEQSDIDQCDKTISGFGYCVDCDCENNFYGTFQGLGHNLCKFTFKQVRP